MPGGLLDELELRLLNTSMFGSKIGAPSLIGVIACCCYCSIYASIICWYCYGSVTTTGMGVPRLKLVARCELVHGDAAGEMPGGGAFYSTENWGLSMFVETKFCGIMVC